MPKTKKAAIILHGIMGSQLFAAEDIYSPDGEIKYKKNELLWIYDPLMNDCFKPFWSIKDLAGELDNIIGENDKVAALACNEDGISINTITTSGIDDKQYGDMGLDGEYGAANTYTDLMVALKSVLGNENALFFNYDWRKSVKDIVNGLRNDFDEIIAKNDVVYFIAHSMGGLVACSYINECQRADKLRLITLGTPFLGAPKALYILWTGKAFPLNYCKSGILEIAKNIVSCYELLPSEQYTKTQPYIKTEIRKIQYNPHSPTGVRVLNEEKKQLDTTETNTFIVDGLNGLNEVLYDKSRLLYQEQNNADLFNNMKYSFAIIGYDKPTITMVITKKTKIYKMNPFYGKHITAEEIVYESSKTKDGDGTVPLFSATIGGDMDKERIFYIKENHGGLVNNKEVIAMILAKIDNWCGANLHNWHGAKLHN